MKYIDVEKTVEILKKINVLMKIQHRSYLSYELDHIISFMESNTKNKQISLPDNLDEAAEEYAYNNWEDNDYHTGASEGLPFDAIGHTEKCFKAGAEWMAKQIKQKHTEVDLEKEYKEYIEDDPVFSKLTNRNVGLVIARHFYELGLKVRKEE